ncbi:MAG: transcriptional repressor [Chloroflexota bacterium]|nr:transcriptional repressor [Chloroflexota bacterium]
MMQQIKRDETLLSQVGQRRTVQRQVILQVIEKAEGHLTIEQLTERIQSILPPVSLSTIYRNVELLSKMGLIRTNHLPGEGTTYELADGNPHVHLLCQRCDSVAHHDVRQLETLQADLPTAAHFHVVSLGLTVIGYCATCWDLLSLEKMREMEA